MNFELFNIGGSFGNGDLILAALNIIAIDLVLAGDNALIIGMSVRKLAPRQRLAGIMLGTAAAVVLRVVFTFFAAQLLEIKFVKLIGGLLIIWIAVKLLKEEEEEKCVGAECGYEEQSLWKAVRLIIIADVTMSADNILAVAGASKGHLGLLIFGLGLSIPIIVCASNFLSKLMIKYPLLVYVGAAILGKVGGDMIISEPAFINAIHAHGWIHFTVPVLTAAGVLLVAKMIRQPQPVNTSGRQVNK
jgi:YjbE family integral membrane protein